MTGPKDAAESPLRVGVAIPAAGSGRRMGGARKAFLELNGEPLLVHALRPFLEDERVVAVVVALAAEDVAARTDWITELDDRVRVVAGGATRTESVRKSLQALPADVDVIAVHDAARPLVTAYTVRRCIDLARTGVGAVAGCPAVDTMKRVDRERLVVETPDRTTLWHAHTPQVFPASLLLHAYESGEPETDDAALVERLGARIVMVDGGAANIKVTRPEDVAIAEAILRARSADA